MRKSGFLFGIFLALSALLLGVALLGGPGRPARAGDEASTPKTAAEAKSPGSRGSGGTLRLLYWQAPTTLNPHLTNSGKDWAPCRITYEPLASYDKDGNLIPFLAEEIPSLENGGIAPDGKSVTWKLKRGIKWSDGEPFTADDILFTYEFISNPQIDAPTAITYAAVKSVEVIDDYTVRIEFKDVNPAWSLPFVGMQGQILARHAFKGITGENARQMPANLMPVGTGPYRVVKFKTQEVLFLGSELIETNKIIYEPNPYFRESDKPFFSRIELKGGGTVEEAARSVLQTGDVDFAFNLQLGAEELAKLESGGKGKSVAAFGFYVERILLNRTDPNRATENGERSSIRFPHPFFSDPKVRQAFALAIDREAIARLYGNTARLTNNVLVSPSSYQSNAIHYDYDPAKAAALLDEAGWKDHSGNGVRDKNGVEMKVVLQTSVNPVRQETQRIIKKNLEAIGVEVELRIIDASVFFSSKPNNPNTRFHFYADMEMFQTGNRSPDPGAYMKWWTCDEISQEANHWSGNNLERWCNPAYDALYNESTTQMDPAKRRQLFIRMNEMLTQDVVVIPLVHRADVVGISNAIEGIEFTPWDAELWNIKDWRRRTP